MIKSIQTHELVLQFTLPKINKVIKLEDKVCIKFDRHIDKHKVILSFLATSLSYFFSYKVCIKFGIHINKHQVILSFS